MLPRPLAANSRKREGPREGIGSPWSRVVSTLAPLFTAHQPRTRVARNGGSSMHPTVATLPIGFMILICHVRWVANLTTNPLPSVVRTTERDEIQHRI